MCVVSMVMDHYRERWDPQRTGIYPTTFPQIQTVTFTPPVQITQAEVDEFRRLLERAREYDKRNNEPDCELDEKKQAIMTIGKLLGLDLSFL